MMNKISRFKLALEFDGRRYSGWQKQQDARTIQGALLYAAQELYGEHVDVQGNGRTDSGVHAVRFIAHLEAATDDTPQQIEKKMNNLLPHDINILMVQKAGSRFHARHNCIGRSYLYQLAKRRTAFCKGYVWQADGLLNVGTMQKAATLLEGMHDFTSFTDRQVVKKKSPHVMINRVQIVETEDLVLVRIIGSHFLWKMVRRIVGVLTAIGKEQLVAGDLQRYLQESVNLSRYTAPAQGLFFERAFYNQEEMDNFLAASLTLSYFF